MTLDNHSIWLADSERGLLRPFVEAQDAAFVAAVREVHPELCPDESEEHSHAVKQVWPEASDTEPVVVEPIAVYPPRWKTIVREVCAKHEISVAEILSRRRHKELVAARHEAFFRLSKETTMSLARIGYRMGGRDHTTVISGIKAHKKRMANAAKPEN